MVVVVVVVVNNQGVTVSSTLEWVALLLHLNHKLNDTLSLVTLRDGPDGTASDNETLTESVSAFNSCSIITV